MELLYKYKRAFLLVGMGLCVVAIVVTINPNYRPTVVVRSLGRLLVPVQGAVNSGVAWLGGQISFFWEMRHLQQENVVLRDRVGWLEMENQRLMLAGEENERLLELLEVRQRYGELPAIGARIIGHDPSEWFYSFNIDRGSNDGIERFMAVLGSGGLVGVIQQVYPTHSRVTAIIDDRFAVAVQSVRTDDQGIIRGDSTLMQQGLVRMDRICHTARIMAGDDLITSVISIFPPGIRVGTVTDVQPTPDGLAQYAIVRPAANVRQLEEVLVITEHASPVYSFEDEE